LVPHFFHALAADWDFEALQPCVQAAAQLDLAVAGSDGLGLKVEDDEAGARSLWDTYRRGTLARDSPKARLDDQ
jgi:hypothetical protein